MRRRKKYRKKTETAYESNQIIKFNKDFKVAIKNVKKKTEESHN